MLVVPSCVIVPDVVQFGARTMSLVNVMLFPLPGVKVSGRRLGDAPSIAPPRLPTKDVGEPLSGEKDERANVATLLKTVTLASMEVALFTVP